MKGQALIWVLLIMMVGFMLIGAWLTILNVNLRVGGREVDREKAYFAALSGIEAVKADLLQGKDLLSPNYTPPSITINGFSPRISISPAAGNHPAVAELYIDPGASSALNPLRANSNWEVKLWGVEAGSTMEVNLSFRWEPDTRPKKKEGARLEVYYGGNLIAAEEGRDSPLRLKTIAPGKGKYTIKFINKRNDADLRSEPFNRLGGSNYTWIRAQLSGKEYIIASQAGNTALMVYLRQIPGPDNPQVPQQVLQWWWK